MRAVVDCLEQEEEERVHSEQKRNRVEPKPRALAVSSADARAMNKREEDRAQSDALQSLLGYGDSDNEDT